MRLTKKIFNDLAIFMSLLGVGVGIIFPFFSLALGVPSEIALTPIYFTSCIIAGIILAVLNITLARKTVGSRIQHMSEKMKHIEQILVNRNNGDKDEYCSPDKCLINVDSEDELGESAASFNRLVKTLDEVLNLNSEIQLFSEMLTSHLALNELSKDTLKHLIKNTGATGGAILIEKGGELYISESDSISNPLSLVNNQRILQTLKTYQRQIIHYPDDIIINGIVVDFQPCELLLEPILYKNTLLGILILVSSAPFIEQASLKLKFFNQELSLAFRNAITHEQMTTLAAVDALTGLYNRRFGSIRLHEEFSRSIRSSAPLSLLMIDIDHFKKVNDTYGHSLGDKVLANIAKITTSSIREGDVLWRYGGEEFLCILPGANYNDAMIVAERMRIMVMDSNVKNFDQDIKVTISIGIATYPNEKVMNGDQLIKLADEALYIAKDSGRNRVYHIN